MMAWPHGLLKNPKTLREKVQQAVKATWPLCAEYGCFKCRNSLLGYSPQTEAYAVSVSSPHGGEGKPLSGFWRQRSVVTNGFKCIFKSQARDSVPLLLRRGSGHQGCEGEKGL